MEENEKPDKKNKKRWWDDKSPEETAEIKSRNPNWRGRGAGIVGSFLNLSSFSKICKRFGRDDPNCHDGP